MEARTASANAWVRRVSSSKRGKEIAHLKVPGKGRVRNILGQDSLLHARDREAMC